MPSRSFSENKHNTRILTLFIYRVRLAIVFVLSPALIRILTEGEYNTKTLIV